MSTFKSVSSFDFDGVKIRIGFPGLVAEQNSAYRRTVLRWLDRLGNGIDLSGLGSIEIAVDHRNQIIKRKVDAMQATTWRRLM